MGIYDTFVLQPLRRLYLLGPHGWGVGFWGGQTAEDICAQMSAVPSTFWVAHMHQCEELIDQHLRRFVVAVESASYLWLVSRCLSACATHLLVVQPLMRELRALRAPPKKQALEDK